MNPDSDQTVGSGHGRRAFLEHCGQAATVMAVVGQGFPISALTAEQGAANSSVPWYRRALRWGQTNITEIDPVSYDVAWWRGYWRDTHIQGVIINAGGIVAYYPSKFPLHHRAEGLGDRDLYRGTRTCCPRGRPLRLRPHGLQPYSRGIPSGPSRLVCRGPSGSALPRR